MKTLKEFTLQLSLLGMKPRNEATVEEVFSQYQELPEADILRLWDYLEPEKVSREWPECSYAPENSLQKRALKLGESVVAQGGEYPKSTDFEVSPDLQHLIHHGKLGLQAFLFAVETANPKVRTPELAPVIEKFMEHMEGLVEVLVSQENRAGIAAAFNLAQEDELSFVEFIRGRLQPFSLVRSLYLEKSSDIPPLQWWVEHERFFPNLPE